MAHSPEVETYTAVQQARLRAFGHMFKRVLQYQDRVASGGAVSVTIATHNVRNEAASVTHTVNKNFTNWLNTTAWRMYRDEFSPRPKLKEAADQVIFRVSEAYRDHTKGISPEAAQVLFERPFDKEDLTHRDQGDET